MVVEIGYYIVEMREEVELKYVLYVEVTGFSDSLVLGVERVGGSKDVF